MKARTIAIPVLESNGLDSRVAPHFGDGVHYLVVEVEDKAVRSVAVRPAPARDAGRWNCRARQFLRTLDCDLVLAPRIGARARTVFADFDIGVANGREGIAREVLADYLANGPCAGDVNRYCPDSVRGRYTAAAHAGGIDRLTGSVSVPIYQTSTFAFTSAAQGARRFAGEEEGFVYTRMGNPTVRALEDCVAGLEGGHAGLATATGMAAVVALYLAVLGKDLHLVATDSLYGPSRVVVERDLARFGVRSTFVDTSNLDAVRAAMRPETRLLFLETPANPTIKLSDIAACAELAHHHGALLAVDNTFMSPYLQRPMEFGADIVLHSMTKSMNGHSDVVAGMLVSRTPGLHELLRKTLLYHGGTIDPHQAWLVLRGIKTLPLRMDRAQANAQRLAAWLEPQPQIEWVRYPGLASHPQHQLARQQMDGPGALISFGLRGGLEASRALLDSVQVPALAVSLGGIESLIQHPASMTHAAMRREDRDAAGITDGLVRLSVGCEDYEDLQDDLEQALARAGNV